MLDSFVKEIAEEKFGVEGGTLLSVCFLFFFLVFAFHNPSLHTPFRRLPTQPAQSTTSKKEFVAYVWKRRGVTMVHKKQEI
jgi:hypothetical protein